MKPFEKEMSILLKHNKKSRPRILIVMGVQRNFSGGHTKADSLCNKSKDLRTMLQVRQNKEGECKVGWKRTGSEGEKVDYNELLHLISSPLV